MGEEGRSLIAKREFKIILQDEKEGRGSFRDSREAMYRQQRDNRREGRGGYYRVGYLSFSFFLC